MFDTAAREDYTPDLDRGISALPRNAPVHDTAAQPRTRYGDRRGPSVPGIALTVLLHVALIGVGLQVRHDYIRKQEAALEVVNLMPPAPPPPSQETPPPPSAPDIIAPTPMVQVPTPAPMIAVAETPSPRPMPTIAPAPPAPPALPPAPPSTVQSSDLGEHLISGKPPVYPVESRRRREQGTVVLWVTIGLDGRVSDISIKQSSGFARLDQSALSAVRKWRWEPFKSGGQPVALKGFLPIPFAISG